MATLLLAVRREARATVTLDDVERAVRAVAGVETAERVGSRTIRVVLRAGSVPALRAAVDRFAHVETAIEHTPQAAPSSR